MPTKFKQLSQDVFVRIKAAPPLIEENCINFFSRPNEITTESINQLPKEKIQSLIKLAKNTIEPELEKKVLRFTNILKKGLDKKYGNNNYTFISIGQSPAVFAETLKIQGIETAICPISDLTTLSKTNLKEIMESSRIKAYLKYLKTIGLDAEKIKKSEKQYIFTDFCASGQSLQYFKTILKANGFNSKNVKFVPIQDIATKYYAPDGKDKKFIVEFIYNDFMLCGLKTRYSPSFRLPVYELDKVQKYANRARINEKFNMLKFLILNEKEVNS